jgi:hypothetical protein
VKRRFGTNQKAMEVSHRGMNKKATTTRRRPSERTLRLSSSTLSLSDGDRRTGAAVNPIDSTWATTSSTPIPAGRVTSARSVVRLTRAVTPSRPFSRRSIRATQAPQVIPPMTRVASPP